MICNEKNSYFQIKDIAEHRNTLDTSERDRNGNEMVEPLHQLKFYDLIN